MATRDVIQSEVLRDTGMTRNGLLGIMERLGIQGTTRPLRPGKRKLCVWYTPEEVAEIKAAYHPKEGFPKGVKRNGFGGKAIRN